MFLRRFFNFEFGAIFFSILHFYLSNYIDSFGLMGLDDYAVLSKHLAYGALAIAILFSFMSIWLHRKIFFRHGNSHKIVLLVVLAFFLLLATQNIGMVLTLPVGLALINTKDKDICQYILYSSLLFYALTVLLYISGFIIGGDKVDTPLFDTKENVKQLYSLGFNNPNVAYKFFMPILLSALYLYGHRRRVVFILFIIAVVIGILTGSTAGLIIATIACISFTLINKNSKLKIAVKKTVPYMFIFFTVLSFLIALLFGSVGSVPNAINDGLTGRPRLWNLRVDNGSYVNFIGNNDQYSTSRTDEYGDDQVYYALDNTYLYLMVHYGLVIYFLYLLVYLKSTKVIKDEKILLIALLLMMAMFIGERSDFFSNMYLLFALKYLTIYYFDKERLNAQN